MRNFIVTRINHERENRNARLRLQTNRQLFEALRSRSSADESEVTWLRDVGFIMQHVLEYSQLFTADPGLIPEHFDKEFKVDFDINGDWERYKWRRIFAWAGWSHSILSGKAMAAECFFACDFLSDGGMNLNVFKRYVEEDGVSAIQKYGKY